MRGAPSEPRIIAATPRGNDSLELDKTTGRVNRCEGREKESERENGTPVPIYRIVITREKKQKSNKKSKKNNNNNNIAYFSSGADGRAPPSPSSAHCECFSRVHVVKFRKFREKGVTKNCEAMTTLRCDSLKMWNVGVGFWTLVFLLAWCLSNANVVQAEPEPGPFYPDSYNIDQENMMMLQRLKQLVQREQEINGDVRELAEKVMAYEGMLDAKETHAFGIPQFPQSSLKEIIGEEDIELLPLPSAMHAPRGVKRGSYMALCHFKICNMGRKRQP